MKQKISDILKKIKEFFIKTTNLIINNKIYLSVFILSIIILIIGSLAIGFIKTFLIILLIDGIFIFVEYKNIKKKKELKEKIEEVKEEKVKKKTRANKYEENATKEETTEEKDEKIVDENKIRSNEVMASSKKVSTKKKKDTKNNVEPTKKKKKKKIGKLIFKIVLIFMFLVGIAAMIAACIFFKDIVDNAPEFDSDNLLMSESSIILDRDGNEIDKFGNEKRETLSYDELPEVLIDAIVATEDSRFFQHNGFDLPRFLKAAVGQAAGNGDAGGASTLTMQIVKNAYTVQNKNTKEKSTGLTGIKRKFTDIYMAIFKLEKKYTKQELLEFYVNYSYLGSNSYGVEQASLTYFNKSAKDLNLSEAALIAGLYQSPGSYDPLGGEENRARAEQRRLTVLNLMERHGYINAEEKEIAAKMTVDKIVVGSRNSNVSPYQSFEDIVLKEVEEKTGWDPNTVPVIIYSTLDRGKQDHINRVMNGELFQWENEAVQGGVAVVDVHNGELVAIGGGRNVGAAKLWNFAKDEVRQIGSTSKPLYDYGPAIEFNNASTYGPVTDEQYTYTGGGTINNWDLAYYGFMTYHEALRTSRNIPALKTFQTVDKANIYKFVTNLGLHPELEDGYLHEAHSIGAYTGETPISLAGAYAAFANKGYYNEPHSFTKVVRRDTGEEYVLEVNSRKAMGEDTAYMITSMLQDAAVWAGVSGVNGVRIAAKTGTTNFDDKALEAKGLPWTAINDLWVAGYDSNYAMAVWYGYKTITSEDAAKGWYTESGNHGNTNLFNAISPAIFSSADFQNPGNVVAVTVEKETAPAMLPSPYTPGDMVVTELFKSGSEPSEVSQRYSQLANATNLKATQSGQNVTLSWSKIATPSAIDQNYLTQYINSVYTNPSWQASKLQERISYNNDVFGSLGYRIYIKNDDGSLRYIDFTENNTYTYKLKTSSDKNAVFVVKTSYSKFESNMSTGIETSLKVSANAADIKAALTTDNTITLNTGDKYNEPANPVKVTENGSDVTNKAKVSKVITKKSDNSTVNAITTTNEETFEIKYTVEYSDETFTLIKTVIIKKKGA